MFHYLTDKSVPGNAARGYTALHEKVPHAVVVKIQRNTLGKERLGPVLQVNVQVRFTRVSRVADAAQHLTCSHTIAWLNGH